MDKCENNPCKNGGDCNPLVNEKLQPEKLKTDESYVCHCMTGFYGKKCEKGI